jgi:hypothetical protein
MKYGRGKIRVTLGVAKNLVGPHPRKESDTYSDQLQKESAKKCNTFIYLYPKQDSFPFISAGREVIFNYQKYNSLSM